MSPLYFFLMSSLLISLMVGEAGMGESLFLSPPPLLLKLTSFAKQSHQATCNVTPTFDHQKRECFPQPIGGRGGWRTLWEQIIENVMGTHWELYGNTSVTPNPKK